MLMRYALKICFMYKGWMYEPRVAKGLWTIMVNLSSIRIRFIPALMRKKAESNNVLGSCVISNWR